MDRKTLRNLRDELATTRLDHDARKRGLDCARELWEKEHATQIADTRTAAQLVAAYETQVRDGAVAIYDMFKDTDVALAKHPVEGVDIRIYTNVTYDASVVTRWIYGRLLTLVLGLHAQGVSTDGILDELVKTPLMLKLDTDAVKASGATLGAPITKSDNPKAFIDANLEPLIGTVEDGILA